MRDFTVGGLKLFYDLFYSCSRGEKMLRKTFFEKAKEYANEALRIVIELLIIREKAFKTR